MKISIALSLLVLTAQLHAQDPAAAATDSKPATEAAQKPKLTPAQQAFLNLPQEKRVEFQKHLGEATRLFKEKRIFECLDELHLAEKVFADSPEVYNLRGSCYVEMRAFDKSLVEFKKALELSEGDASIQFNVGEVYFCQHKWQDAVVLFQEVATKLPKENVALSRLVDFKIMLCQLKLDQLDEAKKLSEKYDDTDDSPYYYYANAAMLYHAGKTVDAELWIARAGKIFVDANITAPWQDTLVEYGYIKSFYGEALQDEVGGAE